MSLPYVDLRRPDSKHAAGIVSLAHSPCGRFLAVGTNELDTRLLILCASSPTHEVVAQAEFYGWCDRERSCAYVAWSSDSSTLLVSNSRNSKLYALRLVTTAGGSGWKLMFLPTDWPRHVGRPDLMALSACSQYVCSTAQYTNTDSFMHYLTISVVDQPGLNRNEHDAGCNEQDANDDEIVAETVASFKFGTDTTSVQFLGAAARFLLVVTRREMFVLDVRHAEARLWQLGRSPNEDLRYYEESDEERGRWNDDAYVKVDLYGEDEDEELQDQAVMRWRTPVRDIGALAASPDGLRVAVAGHNSDNTLAPGLNSLVVLDTVFGLPIQPLSTILTAHANRVVFPLSTAWDPVALVWSPLGTRLAIAKATHMFVFDTTTGAVVHSPASGTNEEKHRSISFLSETECAVGTSDGRVRFFKFA